MIRHGDTHRPKQESTAHMTKSSTQGSALDSAATMAAKPEMKRSRDMQDARPLLQAIFLGIFLAAVLTAAAALAGPDKDLTSLVNNGYQTLSSPFSGRSGI